MKNLFGISLSSLIVILFAFLASCSDKDGIEGDDTKVVQNEAAFEAYQEDADDIGQQAVAADNSTATGSREGLEGGREMGPRPGVKPNGDTRFTCATVTFEFAADNSVTTPHGYITIDFGTTPGCTDRGNVRKGKIKVEFKGKRFMPESFVKITFDNYTINDVKIEGTRTVTNVSGSTETSVKHNIVVAGGKATWPDGTFATREANLTRTWTRSTTNPSQDSWTLSGNASGSNRNQKTYQMEITKPLVYKRECATSNKVFMAVEGTKVLTTESRQVTIDYGSGACDKLITISINGVSVEVDVSGTGA